MIGILTPNRIEPTAARQPFTALFTARDAFIDKAVRLAVIDEDLFKAGPLGKTVANGDPDADPLGVFKRFTTDPKLTQFVQFDLAVGDGSNGVLAVIDTRFASQKKQGEKILFTTFRSPESVKECKPAKTAASLALRVHRDDFELHTEATIRLPAAGARVRSGGAQTAKLIVALIAREGIGELQDTTVLWSNRWSGKGTEKLHPAQRPVSVVLPAAEVGRHGTVGGSGLQPGQPGGGPHDDAAPINITGRYEAFLVPPEQAGLTDPVLMVQLNHTASCVAGWFCWPLPSFLQGKRQALPPLEGERAGVFLARVNDPARPVEWRQGAGSGKNVEDPHPGEAFTGSGRLELVTAGSDAVRMQLKLTFEKDGKSVTLFLIRTAKEARWTFAALDELMDANLKRELIGLQVEPMPEGFRELFRRKLAEGSTLAGHIATWHRSTGTPRLNARENAANVLRALFEPFIISRGNPGPHYHAIRAMFAALALSENIKVDDLTRTTYHWLVELLKEELEGRRLAQPEAKTEELYEQVHQGYRDAGIRVSGEFMYRFEFFALGASGKYVVGFGAYYFDAVVTKHRLTKSGTYEQDATFGKVTLHGGFGDVGIGAEAGVKIGAGGSSVMPEKPEFKTFHDLAPLDFEDIGFWTIGVEVGAISFGPFDIVKAGRSALLHFTLKRPGRGPNQPDLDLVTAVEETWNGPQVKPDQLKRPEIKVSATLAGIAAGYGWMTRRKMRVPPKPDPKNPKPAELDKRRKVEVPVFFNNNQSTLDTMSRFELVELLALERAMFVNVGGWARIDGHASPPRPFDFNQHLSEARASEVRSIIEKAFGSSIKLELIATGHGESLAQKDLLFDPPNDGSVPQSKELWERWQAEKQRYHLYRKVDLILHGVLAATLANKNEDTGG
jgi:outer membrane protein OmpA-like peptidoglycan-associated protein